MKSIKKTLLVPSRMKNKKGAVHKNRQELALDEGLKETFPSSDPVAISITRLVPIAIL